MKNQKDKYMLLREHQLTDSQQNLKEMGGNNGIIISNEMIDSNGIKTTSDIYSKIINLIKNGNSVELIKLFEETKNGFNPNYCNKKGWSLLNLVIDSPELDEGDCKLQIVEKLIELNADVNLGLTTTPLHLASVSGYYEIAKTLIKAGADCWLLDNEDNTPIDLARIEKDREMLKILGIEDENKIDEMLEDRSEEDDTDMSVQDYSNENAVDHMGEISSSVDDYIN